MLARRQKRSMHLHRNLGQTRTLRGMECHCLCGREKIARVEDLGKTKEHRHVFKVNKTAIVGCGQYGAREVTDTSVKWTEGVGASCESGQIFVSCMKKGRIGC